MTIRHVKPVEPMPVFPVNDGAGAEQNETLLTLLLQRGRATGADRCLLYTSDAADDSVYV